MKPKKELSAEEAIKEASNDVRDAMLENIRVNKAIVEVQKDKERARYNLLKAKDRLRGLEMDHIYG